MYHIFNIHLHLTFCTFDMGPDEGQNIVRLDRRFKVNLLKDCIIKQVVTKFGGLKIDDGGDTGMSFDAKF